MGSAFIEPRRDGTVMLCTEKWQQAVPDRRHDNVEQNIYQCGSMSEPVRIDKWLWAARFFKTRGLAVRAIEGGKVRLNQQRVKPAKDLKPGDELVIQIGELEWTLNVVELSERRGPAPVASRLYAETAPSHERRMAAVEARRLQGAPPRHERGRPTKKDRRMIRRFTEEA